MSRQIAITVGVAGAIAFLAAVVIDNLVSSWLNAAAWQSKLEGELSRVAAPPAATLVTSVATHKDVSARVEKLYKSNMPFAEIRAYYDKELLRQGWSFHSEEKVTDWFRDLGGRVAHYCKDGLDASLEFAGAHAHYGWDFALILMWKSLEYPGKPSLCQAQPS